MGSCSTYVDRFCGPVLREYLWGNQGRPYLCYSGSYQPHGVSSEGDER